MSTENTFVQFEINKSVCRNITIGTHRTSIRLEPEIWAALEDICVREIRSVSDICFEVACNKPLEASLTGALRIYILSYFRTLDEERERKDSPCVDTADSGQAGREVANWEASKRNPRQVN